MNLAGQTLTLTYVDLAVATLLVVIAGIVSIALRLNLEKKLAYAALRTSVQLILTGYVLKYVFTQKDFFFIGSIVLLMLVFASASAVKRPDRLFVGAKMSAFISLSLSSLVTVYSVLSVVIGVRPWYEPQFLIPLLGMMLGNGLNGVSLCLGTLLERLSERKHEIELHLSLGASRWEAALDAIRDAVRTGMVPIINSMMIVGVVSLPGMMSGQIIAGADPIQAVKYQIVIMFMVAAATSTGCILMAVFVFRNLFNARHQLEAHRIITNTKA